MKTAAEKLEVKTIKILQKSLLPPPPRTFQVPGNAGILSVNNLHIENGFLCL
jgi:hypothetical protein